MTNIGLLKLELIAYGIKAKEGLPEPLANPFGLVHLVLPDTVAVSVHRVEDSSDTPFTLSCVKGRYFLDDSRKKTKPLSVSWTPPLKAYQMTTSSGLKVSEILTVHGGFIAVHPKGPCRFGLSGLTCRYCGSSQGLASPPHSAKLNEPPPQRLSADSQETYQHPPFTKKDLVEALKLVLKEKRCDFVNLSSGRVETEDGGVEWLEPWVEEIRKNVNILISLDLVPPKNKSWIDKTYAMGVDALYYDLDFFNPLEADKQECNEQDTRQLEALEYAAKVFPKGAVLSHVVIGLEPVKETEKRMKALLDRGVIPVLVYFPPYPDSALAKAWKVAPKQAAVLYANLYAGITEHKNTPHWVQQRDVVLTPLEGRFFSPKSASFDLALRDFYQTSFGRSWRLKMTSLRRRLRRQKKISPAE